jgi:hypothetical protein
VTTFYHAICLFVGTPRNDTSKKTNDSICYQTVLDDIALTDVKSCGPILDGCKVSLNENVRRKTLNL